MRILNQLERSQIEQFLLVVRVGYKTNERKYVPDTTQWFKQWERFRRQHGNRFEVAFNHYTVLVTKKINGNVFGELQEDWLVGHY